MTWRLQLRAGSFRGVPFRVEEHEGVSGRRVQVHEYPGRDQPYPEDLGRASGRFDVTAYVLGDFYFAHRDALIRACEQPGPGRLVHPYLGERQVVCTAVRWAERRDEGRLCRFELQFVEAGERRYPTQLENTIATVLQLATAAEDAVRQAFATAFSIAGFPLFVADSAAGVVRTVASKLDSLGRLGATATIRADLAAATATLADTADALVATPDELAREAAGGLSLYRRTAPRRIAPDEPQTRRDVVSGLGDFTKFEPDHEADDLESDTPARRRQRRNTRALRRLVQRQAVIEIARAITRMNWPSYDDAAAARERVRRLIDPVILDAGDAGDDDAYRALQTMAAATLRDITRRGADLTPLMRYERPRRIPSLVLAHQLYQDADRAGELVRRTGARHPAFMPRQGRVLAE